ncbi:hypothetical protein MMC15_004981 [Xylographa vitiligo]|nr:hypothetical protein [Xylographa vitiligo]
MAADIALSMMALAQLGDTPFIFTLKPGWANSIGTHTKFSCAEAITKLPRSTGLVDIEFRRPRIITVGACAIGIYVTKPDPSGITVITEIWDRVVDWTTRANSLNTAAASTGWVITTHSGIQICFWEPEVLDRHHMCEIPKTYTIKRAVPMTIALCLDILYIPETHTSAIGTTTTFSSGGLSTATASLASNVPGPSSPDEDIITGAYRSVPTWSKPQFSADACFDVIRSLHQAPISIVGNRIFMKYAHIYSNNICTCGFFLTKPPASGQGMEVEVRGMNMQEEANKLFMGTVLQNRQGGFVDLPNGMQLVLYDSAIDPKHICWLTVKVSLRACLNRMVEYHSTATRSIAEPTSSVAQPSHVTN